MKTKLFHVSDIHLRNFKRHEEYKRVFKSLYKYISDIITQDDIIVLTGDIVHSKTDVTPELYNEVQLFLKTLCRIGKVVLIPGNHDANLANSNRLDALTPIVNAMNEKNLIYLKDTCVETINGIDFYHWSVFDEKSKWISPSGNRKKVCLYHGLVNAAKNDTGYQMFSEYVKVSDFKGFDLVLLGDIHTYQTLQEYEIEEIEIDESDLEKYKKEGWEIVEFGNLTYIK